MVKNMKDWYLKLNSEQKVIFINFILLFAGLILILPFSIIFTLYGLLIGWAVGSLANIIASILIFKSTSLLLTDKPAVGLYIVYYICRVLIYVAVFVLLASMQWLFHIEVFYWSILSCAVSLLPPQLILMKVYKGK